MRRFAGRWVMAVLCSVMVAAAPGASAFASIGGGGESGAQTGEDVAYDTAVGFFTALKNGNYALAGESCSGETAEQLGLSSMNFGISDLYGEQFGDFSEAMAQKGLTPEDEATRLTAYLSNALVREVQVGSRVVLSLTGNEAYVSGSAAVVGFEAIDAIDKEAIFAGTLEQFKEEQAEEWSRINQIKNAVDRGAELLGELLPLYTDNIIAAVDALEPCDCAWTMTVDITQTPAVITSLDLNLISPEAITYAVPEESLKFWNQSFYGWWIITDAAGNKESFNNVWYDCCADIALDASGEGTIVFWDEDTSREDWLGGAAVHYENVGTFGSVVSDYGWFWGEELAEGAWTATPGDYVAEDLIGISGSFDDGEGSFNYTIYLRPWGVLWDDLAEDDRPYYYEDWYLPLINAEEPLPDSMDIPEETE